VPAESLEFRLRQLIFPGIRIGREAPAKARQLAAAGVGGFCVYYGTPQRVRSLVEDLQKRAPTPLLMAADYEDGPASQVRGATRLPSNMGLAAAGRLADIEEKARLTCVEADAMGIRWIFAPVVDLADRPENPIVNIRAFSDDPQKVQRYAQAYLRGIRRAGLLSCTKHFPGHGDVAGDSHLTLPKLKVSLARLTRHELPPFVRTAKLSDSVMLAHLLVAALDRRHPATLSKAAMRLLRRRMGSHIAAVTDALDMKAVADRYDEVEAAALALAAGADVILVPKYPQRLLRELPKRVRRLGLEDRVAEAWTRVKRLKHRAGLADGGRPRGALRQVGSPSHLRRAQQLADRALASVGRTQDLLPARYVRVVDPHGQARAFITELKRLGVRVGRGAPLTLVVASYHPRAYSGKIFPTQKECRRLQQALSEKSALLLSFGSPFVFRQLNLPAGLCAFSPSNEAQRAMARAVVGRIRAAGQMPVTL
jgi:beta-glucosidase-like glycosyl hydrolase